MDFGSLVGLKQMPNSNTERHLNNLKSLYNSDSELQGGFIHSVNGTLTQSVDNKQYNQQLADEIEEMEYQILQMIEQITKEISEVVLKSNKKLTARQDQIKRATQEALMEFRLRRGSMTKEELSNLLRDKISPIIAFDEDLVSDYITRNSDKITNLGTKITSMSSLVGAQSGDFASVLTGINRQNKVNCIDFSSKKMSLENYALDSRIKNNTNEFDFGVCRKNALEDVKTEAFNYQKNNPSFA